MKRISLTLLFLLVCLPLAFAQKSDPPSAIPCCGVVSIDRVNGIVTAKILKTGKTFQFEVDSRSLLKTLRVGQKVWVNAATRRVGFTERDPCCTVIGNTNLDLGDSDRPSAEKGSTGVLRNGKTLTIEQGFEATIDPKRRGVVRVRDLGTVRPTSEYSCACDPDENAEASACRWQQSGNKLYCASGTACTDCDVYETTKLGNDKAQDQSSPGTSTSPATAAGGRNDPGRTLVTSPVRWEMKPSADLKGTLGQIVVQFPGMTSGGNNYVAVFEVGGKDRISTATYGNKNFPLLDGEYDVEVNSVRVSRVPVKRGMDTRIHIGTIRFDVPSSTSVEVYDITQKTRLCLSYGSMMCGAPSGEYVIKVGGSTRKVAVADGQVIDF